MCGIVVGLSFGKLNKRDEDIRQRLLRFFTTEMLIATEERGKDATGAVVLFEDGNYIGLKRGEQVTDYLAKFGTAKEYYGSLLKVWRDHDANSKVYLGHCRAATTGDKADNENNHPIKVGNLVGVHNGVIRNHDEIFKNLGCQRDGKVDSESIFRLMDHYTNQGKEPFTMDIIQNVVDRLDGQFAVAAFNADNLEQVPMFRDGRPIELILIKPLGILLATSDKKFWSRVHYRYERRLFYYDELNGIKLPPFLDKDLIEVTDMPDDHALIFDLTKKVTKDTEIEDLCEKKKIDRTNKKWKATTTTTSYNQCVHKPTYSAPTNYNKKKEDKKKRRVFDKIKKHYIVKEGDKELTDEQSATLLVDKAASNKEDKKEETGFKTVNKRKFDRTPITDGEEEKTSVAVNVKDHTRYNTPEEDKDNTIEVPPEDIKVVEEPEIVEVMMNSFPKEAVQAASRAMKDMPDDKKGYGDMEDLLSDIDVKDEKKAEGLGMLIVANRVAQAKMLAGFMAGYSVRMKEEKDDEDDASKSRKREKHITGLKSLALLLAKFYDKSKTLGNESYNDTIRQKLAQVTLDDDKRLDVENLLTLFNKHERGVLDEVKEVILQADQYKEASK